MNGRQHALLARRLVSRCGGLREAARVCRLNRSRLAECQDPDAGAFLPADVINDLELYCGEALYSKALADDRPTQALGESLAEEAQETVEEAALLQRLIRMSVKAGVLSKRTKTEILKDALELKEVLDRLVASASGDD